MSGELPRGQRVRVSQDPIEGVVTNPNGPVIRVERPDGGSFLFEPLTSAKIELLGEPEVKVQAIVVLSILGGWDGTTDMEVATDWVVDTAADALAAADPDDHRSLMGVQWVEVTDRADLASRCDALWNSLMVVGQSHGVEIPEGRPAQHTEEPTVRAAVPFCCYISPQSQHQCAALAEYGITYVHGENITHAAETHSCHRHLTFLIEAAPSWAVEEHGAWTHSLVWRLPS